MTRADQNNDPEDMFAETRMSFGDHIEELRIHLFRAIAGFVVALILSLFIGQPVLRFIARPVENELQDFYERRVEKLKTGLKSGDDPELEAANRARTVDLQVNRRDLAKIVGAQDPGPAVNPEEDWVQLPVRVRALDWALETNQAQRLVNRPATLATMNVTEAFMVYFKVCMVCGLVIGSPWIFWQLWSFIAAGLYPHEKRYVNVYLPFSLGLFLAGFFMCERYVIPQSIHILLEFNEWIGLEPDLRLNEWLSFALLLPLIFGISFQTPLVMQFLAKFGIFDVDTYRRKRRIAWFVMAIFAAIITPTPDALTMTFMWLPMCLLYELGIYLAKFATRSSDLDIDVPDSEEMVEV